MVPSCGGGASRKFSFTTTCGGRQLAMLERSAWTESPGADGVAFSGCCNQVRWPGLLETAEMRHLSALEVESPKSGFRGTRFLCLLSRRILPWPSRPSSVSLARRRITPVSASVVVLPSSPHLPSVRVCPSLHLSPFCKDTSRVGSGPTRLTSPSLHLQRLLSPSAVTFTVAGG